MPDNRKKADGPHTEVRRQDRPEDSQTATDEAPKLKPRMPEERVPGSDEDDLFNDMPV